MTNNLLRNCIEKVTQACDEYFDTHRFDGPYCNCEKNHHHHMTVVRIVAGHRQVFHRDWFGDVGRETYGYSHPMQAGGR
jgi:hypothetical protein